ncbi:MAG: hypothetical protein HY748_07380 [Elusimicrobia bacterium]|nr:hypothetical protein [Elusimicrobiota bacterium]
MAQGQEAGPLAARFIGQKNKDYLYFQAVYGILAAHFLIMGLVYLMNPESALEPFYWLGVTLGGREYPVAEHSHVWRVLAGTNVLTLGFLCVFLQLDVKRHWPAIYPLVFMKGATALAFMGVRLFAVSYPAFWAVAVRDAAICGLFVYFGGLGKKAAEEDESVLVPRPLGYRAE